MCGITSNSQDGGENDGKINDLKLRDSTRATMVSRREKLFVWHNNMLDNDVEHTKKKL